MKLLLGLLLIGLIGLTACYNVGDACTGRKYIMHDGITCYSTTNIEDFSGCTNGARYFREKNIKMEVVNGYYDKNMNCK